MEALRARLPGLPWAVLGETGSPGSVDVGVLSAWPITEVRGHRDQVLQRPDGSTTTFARGCTWTWRAPRSSSSPPTSRPSRTIEALEQDGALLRVASDRPAGAVWTYAYNGNLQAIDHLLLARNAGGVYLPESFRAVRDSSRGLGGSDHAVVADFILTP